MTSTEVNKRLRKAAKAARRSPTSTTTSKAAAPTRPSASDLADAIIILGGLDTIEGPDADAIAFKAAATLVQAGTGGAGLAKAMSAPAQTLITEAREMLAKTPAERYQYLGVLAAMRDGGNPDQFRMLQPIYSKQASRVAAVTPITVPAVAKVAGPKPDPDVLMKRADQVAADLRARLDKAVDAARQRQGAPRR